MQTEGGRILPYEQDRSYGSTGRTVETGAVLLDGSSGVHHPQPRSCVVVAGAHSGGYPTRRRAGTATPAHHARCITLGYRIHSHMVAKYGKTVHGLVRGSFALLLVSHTAHTAST